MFLSKDRKGTEGEGGKGPGAPWNPTAFLPGEGPLETGEGGYIIWWRFKKQPPSELCCLAAKL